VPDGGLVARLGGDELAMLLPGLDGPAAAALAERVRQDVQLRPIVDTNELRLSVSQGVAVAHGPAATAHTLMHDADWALYQAKATRDRVALAGRARTARVLPVQRDAPDDETAATTCAPPLHD
jgi:diguanylate cyclase (GGDEF)-like protein